MKETDEFILFIERMARIRVLIDKECQREWLGNFTEKELLEFMEEIYHDMLYFLGEPFKELKRKKTFKQLKDDDFNEKDAMLVRYKYKCANKKNLRSIFFLQRENNEYNAVFLNSFLEDGDKNKSDGPKSYKKAIKVAIKRLQTKYQIGE